MKYLVTCPFGLSSILNSEIKRLWYKTCDTFVRWTYVEWDIDAMYQLNLRSRIANKVYLQLHKGRVTDFDQLFNVVNDINWTDYISIQRPIKVSVNVNNSKLNSTRTIQSIAQKAIIKKLVWEDRLTFDQESESIEVLVNFDNDTCSVYVNTSGKSLHNRWYRLETGDAPIKENVAAGMVLLSSWRFKEPISDPFCGSGTILIEAAMIARNIAPWLDRYFAFELFPNLDRLKLEDYIKQAESKIYNDSKYSIYGYDIDDRVLTKARANADRAWVADTIEFVNRDFDMQSDLEWRLVTNPPYGKRLMPDDLDNIYSNLAKKFSDNPNLKWWVITMYREFENMVSRKDWNKKILYNGAEECDFWTRKI